MTSQQDARSMTQRERWLATAGFGPVDRTFLLPPWVWQETSIRWSEEGLPAGTDLSKYFRTDQEMGAPVAMQGKYGRNLIIQGGIDKRALARGREDIEREVLSKVPWLCMQGGYFPQVDHLVPPDVSLDNYRHYSALLRAIVENPEQYREEARRRGLWRD